jgi:hypothetical protein
MSTLQLSLAILGGLVLAGVVGHSAWQARRMGVKQVDPRPTAPRPLREPTMGPEGGDTAPAVLVAADLDSDGEHAPTDPDDVLTDPPLVAPPVARRASHRIDPLIDAIAPLRLEHPVSAEQALQHYPLTRRAGSKPFLIEGLDADTGTWEPIAPGHVYRELQAGVQLANRVGGLNEIEYSEFVQKVQAFADGVGALPDFPDMLEVVARARELDAFACARDAQLAMRLQAGHVAWSVAYVQQQAAQHGFVAGGVPGRLVLPAQEEAAPPVITLQFDAQAAFAEDPDRAVVRELVLAFDVPQSPAEDRPYDLWCSIGLELADSLDASLHDDSGQALAPESLPAVGEELHKLYVALAERDLAAGSAAARRLFS